MDARVGRSESNHSIPIFIRTEIILITLLERRAIFIRRIVEKYNFVSRVMKRLTVRQEGQLCPSDSNTLIIAIYTLHGDSKRRTIIAKYSYAKAHLPLHITNSIYKYVIKLIFYIKPFTVYFETIYHVSIPMT